MLVRIIRSIKPLKNLIRFFGDRRAYTLLKYIIPYLNRGSSVIDVGAGVCNVAHLLYKSGYNVTPLDVVNLSMVSSVEPVLYDGVKIPYKNKQFDCGLLVMVLHHLKDVDVVFDETVRVSKQVIVIEDVYGSVFRKYITYILDSLFNLEFFGHARSNKTDKEWKKYFKDKNLKLVSEDQFSSYFFLRHKVYVLTPVAC